MQNNTIDQSDQPSADKARKSFRCRVNEIFRKFAGHASVAAGSKWAFATAVLSIIIWLGYGPREQYSNTWQLIINTGTTIITFLMVFLIQNTQNRDSKAIHLKLDELVRSIGEARNKLVNVEEMSDEDLDDLQKDFERVRLEADRRTRGQQTSRDAAEAKREASTAKQTAEQAEDIADDARELAESAQSDAAKARDEVQKVTRS